MKPTTTSRCAALAFVSLLALSACGDDEPASTATTAPTVTHAEHTESADSAEHAMTVTIEGVDDGFEDVPDSGAAGTALSFHDNSTAELHELVVFRLPDDETRPLPEPLQLPQEELMAILGAPATVLLQPPGSPDVIVPVGDGTLAEPGRYALMCFILIGADPAEYVAAAAANGEAPQGVAGGPPHFTAGMHAELVVTD